MNTSIYKVAILLMVGLLFPLVVEPRNREYIYVIKDFNIDLSDKNNNRMACFGYTERIEITKVDDLILNDIGEYVIKVLVKYDEEKLYGVQMLHPLTIK